MIMHMVKWLSCAFAHRRYYKCAESGRCYCAKCGLYWRKL